MLRGVRQLRREGQVDWFELRGGNEVVLYWRFLKVASRCTQLLDAHHPHTPHALTGCSARTV